MTETVLVGISLAILTVYHVKLYYRVQRTPEKTAYGRHKVARSVWLEHNRGGGPNGILVVQTLRNWIMSASFLASTSILMALGTLGFTFTSNSFLSFIHEMNMLGSVNAKFLLIKFMMLSFAFMIAFFCFTFSVRFLTHSGFTINIPESSDGKLPAGMTGEDLNKGAYFYFLGLRVFYLSVPLAVWLFGPIWLLLATVVVLIGLIIFD